MNNLTKLIGGITALLIAIGTLVGTISMTIGKSPDQPVPSMTIILSTPDQYEDFIRNHPSSG